MGLTINSQPGLIGIKTTRGQLNIESRAAELNIHQEHGRVSLKTSRPAIEINQYEARAQIGYKSVSDITLELAHLGMQKAFEFIAQKTEEGNRLRAIEKGGNPVREIAIEKAWPQKQRQGGYTPITGPRFNATPGNVQITPPEVKNPSHIGYEAEFMSGELNINYNPGKVSIYMRQYPEVNIDVRL